MSWSLGGYKMTERRLWGGSEAVLRVTQWCVPRDGYKKVSILMGDLYCLSHHV